MLQKASSYADGLVGIPATCRLGDRGFLPRVWRFQERFESFWKGRWRIVGAESVLINAFRDDGTRGENVPVDPSHIDTGKSQHVEL